MNSAKSSTHSGRSMQRAVPMHLPEVSSIRFRRMLPQFVKDYYDYYKTKRGYHKRSLNSNGGWNKTSALSFLNTPLLTYSDEIRSAVLMIHGEKAHSRYFSEDAFKKLKGDNKELMIIPGASHVDLYDRVDIIPFDKIEQFFLQYLK